MKCKCIKETEKKLLKQRFRLLPRKLKNIYIQLQRMENNAYSYNKITTKHEIMKNNI